MTIATQETSIKDRLKYYGIPVKMIQRITAEKGWGLNETGFSEAYIRQVIDPKNPRQCAKIEDLIDLILYRAEYIYSV